MLKPSRVKGDRVHLLCVRNEPMAGVRECDDGTSDSVNGYHKLYRIFRLSK
jgi:hypothetical protein